MDNGGKEKSANHYWKRILRDLMDSHGFNFGGGTGIRTLGGRKPTTVFETVPFSRSGIPPYDVLLPAKCTFVKQGR